MNLKQAVLDEAKIIDPENAHNLASLSLYKILNHPYFNNNYAYLNIHQFNKKDKPDYWIGHPDLSNTKGLTNQLKYGGHLSIEEDFMCFERRKEASKIFLHHDANKNLKTFYKMLKNSNSFHELSQKVMQEAKNNEDFLFNIHFYAQKPYHESEPLIKVLFHMIPEKEFVHKSDKLKHSIYLAHNPDVPDTFICRDYFLYPLGEFLRSNKTIDNFLVSETVKSHEFATFINTFKKRADVIGKDDDNGNRTIDYPHQEYSLPERKKIIQDIQKHPDFKNTLYYHLAQDKTPINHLTDLLDAFYFDTMKHNSMKYIKKNIQSKSVEELLEQHQDNIKKIETIIENKFNFEAKSPLEFSKYEIVNSQQGYENFSKIVSEQDKQLYIYSQEHVDIAMNGLTSLDPQGMITYTGDGFNKKESYVLRNHLEIVCNCNVISKLNTKAKGMQYISTAHHFRNKKVAQFMLEKTIQDAIAQDCVYYITSYIDGSAEKISHVVDRMQQKYPQAIIIETSNNLKDGIPRMLLEFNKNFIEQITKDNHCYFPLETKKKAYDQLSQEFIEIMNTKVKEDKYLHASDGLSVLENLNAYLLKYQSQLEREKIQENVSHKVINNFKKNGPLL